MTKSQNTKNEQLTEQWKKGELPNGYYWICLSWGGMVIMAYHTAFDGLFELDDHYYDSDEISEVLAPVPTFDEWQAKLAENAQLKELLKECSIANTALVGIMDWLRKSTIPEQRESCEKLFEKAQELQKQLDEVLK